MSSSFFLEAYDSLDVIGNGSFGVIRKVRRKSDGIIFARKELNFERMSERDRKQIVAEVNILKDLHHDHIVRYHDRYVDRDAGILYILMEYCGGGDLSTIIKHASKQNRVVPEDTIWNYFYQILQALHHCHHPNNHQRSGSGSASNSPPFESEGNSSRRAQILHRDLKPDNVFLDDNNTVKLGDFGLSKALAQASFANTYVGTPYYMSPELMQEKAYDSKSDIWSLGCLIYELCALKPPFHEAKTHSELSIFIRNGRIPPLPRGYSQALTSVIKSMLNLNPAMRPSAAQLLQHERIETIHKVTEATRMFEIVKSHRLAVANREREATAREQALQEKEQRLVILISQKDQEISSLKKIIEEYQKTSFSAQDVDLAVKQAIVRREEELRVLVMEREEEVAASMNKREEEIMEAVQRRDAEICDAWVKRECEIRKEVEENYKSMQERVDWITKKEWELKDEEVRLEEMREQLEEGTRKFEENIVKGRKDKNPLEEVKNLPHPQSRPMEVTPIQRRRKLDTQTTPRPDPTPIRIVALETPIIRPTHAAFLPSAMKGVVLTATGETLATPAPTELSKLFDSSPKVGLNFAKIFDFDEGEKRVYNQREEDMNHSPPPSPSSRKERERAKEKEKEKEDLSESSVSSTSTNATPPQTAFPPTRIRRPSIRTSTRSRSVTVPASASEPSALAANPLPSSQVPQPKPLPHPQPKPLPHPHLRPSTSNSNLTSLTRLTTLPARNHPPPDYDFADEENLPSPFLKRTDKLATIKSAPMGAASVTKPKRSSGLLLRAVAAANNVGRRSAASQPDHNGEQGRTDSNTKDHARPSLASARKASEEARKALSRP